MKAFRSTITLLWVLLIPCSLSVAAEIEVKPVHFAAGASSATVKGALVGDKIIDYRLGAKAGQTMTVTLKTNNGANYFNLIAPGETDVAFFVGSTSGNRFHGALPANGDYTVRVYLMRSAARRNEKANYTLTVGITSAASAKVPPRDAKVAGTNYHATGEIPCAISPSQPSHSCPFGVTRQGNGTATVTVTRTGGGTRTIHFTKGHATGYDQSQADSGKFSARKQGDLSIIQIGGERYEIPDAVVSGG
jgi:hypothetical protein